jgi:hypothetical protein
MEFEGLAELVRARRFGLGSGFACFTAVIITNDIPVKKFVCAHHKTETIPDHNNIYQCRIIHERFIILILIIQRCSQERIYSPIRVWFTEGQLSFPAYLSNSHISELVKLFSDVEEDEELVRDRLNMFWPLLNGRSCFVVAFASVKFDEHSQSMISSVDLDCVSVEVVF